MTNTIQVLYSCIECGLQDVKVEVEARTVEDVVTWMKEVGNALGADHFRRSPHCRTLTFSEVKIPITGASKIGGPVEN
jgi:hypothetical protein